MASKQTMADLVHVDRAVARRILGGDEAAFREDVLDPVDKRLRANLPTMKKQHAFDEQDDPDQGERKT